MKIKNKGKVHPSPSSSSSSSSSSSPNTDALSLLKLLPATILTLASALSLEDREVLLYMITRSMKTPSSSSSSSLDSTNKKKCKKPSTSAAAATATHKPPLFDCDCFDCYTCYWFRWDSSSNRELIHQAIEAFEDHLIHGEKSKKNNNGRGKKREKMSRRVSNVSEMPPLPEIKVEESLDNEDFCVVPSPEDDVSPMVSSENFDGFEGIKEEEVIESTNGDMPEMTVLTATAASNHKGLARKVLPDVLGLLNSRLWSLWSPNV